MCFSSSLWPQYCQDLSRSIIPIRCSCVIDLSETTDVCKVMHKLKSLQNQDLLAYSKSHWQFQPGLDQALFPARRAAFLAKRIAPETGAWLGTSLIGVSACCGPWRKQLGNAYTGPWRKQLGNAYTANWSMAKQLPERTEGRDTPARVCQHRAALAPALTGQPGAGSPSFPQQRQGKPRLSPRAPARTYCRHPAARRYFSFCGNWTP